MGLHKRFTGPIPGLKHRGPILNHVFVDTESNWSQTSGERPITSHTMRFGCARYCRWDGTQLVLKDIITFGTTKEFWKWLHKLDCEETTWVWAHNLAFDGTLLGLWTILQSKGCKLAHFTDCDLPAFFQANIRGKPYQFLDSLNIFKASLSSIGKELGLEKMDMPEQSAPLSEWVPYCQRDVEILHLIVERWIQFLDKHKLGKMSPSLAGQALTAYRSRFMDHPINLHCDKHVTALERDAYYGGLVEPKYVGKVPKGVIYEYDVNSLYPYVMKKHTYPNLLMGFDRWCGAKQLAKNMERYYCIAHVQLNTTLGVFPLRHKGRLNFPLGTYWTTLQHPELVRAKALGAIKEVAFCAYYTTHDLFSEYVDFFHKLKNEYDKPNTRTWYWLSKLLMNCLYGKFGQRRPLWEQYSEDMVRELELKGGLMEGELDLLVEHIQCKDKHTLTFEHPYNNVVYGARRLLGQDQILMAEEESSWSFPAIAGAVTAYAREYVRNIQAIIGRHNCYYTDTDSFFVNAKGKKILEDEMLIHDTLLGKLKAKTVNEWMIIHGPKDYETNNETKRKGVRAKAELREDGKFYQEQWPGFKSLAKQGFTTTIQVKTIAKKLKRELLTMNVGKDNWTYPLVLQLDNRKSY